MSQEDEDALLAKRLQQQFELEDTVDVDAQLARQLMNAESDEMMARRLQNEWSPGTISKRKHHIYQVIVTLIKEFRVSCGF